jgi:hypothetical protein
VVSRTCDQCGATVAADEQFCPSCGSFIDPLSTTPASRPQPEPVATARPSGNVISVSSDGPYEEFSLDQPPAEAVLKSVSKPRGTNGSMECPSCGTPNPSTNLHCQNCGARLRQGPLPTAPRPAVQVTAGVRAALAISGLLLIVILVALAFNIFGGDETATTTTVETSTTTSQVVENAIIPVLNVECEPQGLGSFACSNLAAGIGSEFQVNWEELEAAEETLQIRILFSQAMTVSRLEWVNIADETRFLQNHRARGITIDADNQVTSVNATLEDIRGSQIVNYVALNANYIDVTVYSTHRSQVVSGNSYPEMAIDEIVVWGRPYVAPGG